jgi:multisubunit Na+/H+ antiporter MnhB subunit
MKVIVGLTILLVMAAALVYVGAGIPFGHPVATDMDDYYLRHGQEETGANNIVTSVLFDYRGLDTLGEASVLFTAVLGVSVMFRKRFEGEEYEND